MTKHPCPCCGYLVFEEPPGSYDSCPICFWEDDPLQLAAPGMSGGANEPSLLEAQQSYATIGACEPRFAKQARKPGKDDRRDPGFRPLDPARDYVGSLPKKHAEPYYWRRAD